VLYDDRAVYVGVICYDAHPQKIVRQLTRRDRSSEADRFSVMIDSYYDRQTAFVFVANVSGVQSDGVLSQDGNVYDITWDAVWNVRTRVFQDGWSAEFEIPYNALRFAQQPDGVYRWGINFRRYISRKKETDEWVMVPRSETLQISKWGTVDGIRGIAPPLHLELLPYVSGTAQYETATNVHPWTKAYRGQAGVDLKYGLGTAFTLIGSGTPASTADNLAGIQQKVKVHECDLTDMSSVFSVLKEVRPDAVFHVASHANVRASFINPLAVLQNNIMGTANLLEAIRLVEIDPYVQICSTSEVYGQGFKNEVPIKEDQPMRCSSPYAVSKAAQDLLGLAYFNSYKMKIIRTRMFAYINPRRADLFATSFTRQVARVEAGLQKELVHGNLDSVRTLIDVRDAMESYWAAIERCEPGEAYNIGGNSDLITHEQNGWLAQPFESADLARGLGTALGNDDLRLAWGRRARNIVLEQFTARTIARRYAALYADLLA